MDLVFDWDENKARHNRNVHKISFDETKTIFNDPFLISFPDEYHSEREERFISIGTSSKVVHTENAEDDAIVIRLISARKATASERAVYEQEQE